MMILARCCIDKFLSWKLFGPLPFHIKSYPGFSQVLGSGLFNKKPRPASLLHPLAYPFQKGFSIQRKTKLNISISTNVKNRCKDLNFYTTNTPRQGWRRGRKSKSARPEPG
jgi:hypothetical protein